MSIAETMDGLERARTALVQYARLGGPSPEMLAELELWLGAIDSALDVLRRLGR